MKNQKTSGADASPIVIIVDDDAGVRSSLVRLFGSVGLETKQHASALEFMESSMPDAPRCLVLDVRMPGLSGLELQGRLVAKSIAVPIIFMTGHGDVPMSVDAMKLGAVDFLIKPFRDQDMLDAVASAIETDRESRTSLKMERAVRQRFELLSPREAEIMKHVTAGLMNKQIAGLLDLSEITVKIHRGKAMRKMEAKSLPDLVRMAEVVGLGDQS